MLDRQQPQDKQTNDDLTDERVPFWLCWLGAISEIEIDPHADMNADYEAMFPEQQPATFTKSDAARRAGELRFGHLNPPTHYDRLED